jgi:CubicO group peptidase (beta-lactamase class C family)
MSLRQFWIAATAALALVSGCASSDSDASSTPSSSTPSAEACPTGLDDALQAWGDAGFSGVVTLVHAGTQCSQGVGLRDREESEPMTPDTVFAIGSVSKSVTATGILHLIADRQLTLATRAGDVVTDLTGPVADVTVEQVLSHTSGILGDAGPDHQPLGRDAAIAAISALPQVFEPGSDFGYTNAGYTLLALAIDTITGDYRDFIADKILPISGKPTRSGFWDGEPAAQGPRAIGYLDAGRSEVVGQFQGPHWSTSGNGDMAMTAPDLATWALNLFDGGLLPAPETAELETPRWDHGEGLSETLGWVRFDESVFGAEGFASAGGGGDTGHSAIIAVIPDRDTAIAIASNGPDINAEQLMQQLLPALIAGDPLPLPADTSTGDADPAAIAAAVGTYTFADGSEIEVGDDGGRLTVAAIGPTAIDSIFSLPEPFTPEDVDAHEAAVIELLTGDNAIGAEERDGVRGAVGEIVEVVVHGSVVEQDELHTYVTVIGSDASLEIWYALADNSGVAAAEGPTDPPSATFAAGPAGEFVNSDPTER